MSLPASGHRTLPAPLILVVDDDRRVLDLLQIALTAHHYRVSTAVDGDEAIKKALVERPDLIVLDVRLPKKSGLEVCDFLRHDPDDPQLPIILVSAAADTDARLEGLGRGADDFLSKPFSPKELIARIKRLLVRNTETRHLRRRTLELERELTRTQDDARRAHQDMKKEQRLRELAYGLGRELHRTLDVDTVAHRLLAAAEAQLGVGGTSLLMPERSGGPFVALVARGESQGRLATLSVRADGELATLIAGLGRPVARQDLERFPELRPELPGLVAAGIALIAPLRGSHGLEALIVTDERRDGQPFAPGDLEALAGLCELGAIALHNSRRFKEQMDAALDLLAERASTGEAHREAIAEANAIAIPIAANGLLPPRERSLFLSGVALGPWGWSTDGLAALRRLEAQDPTHRMSELLMLIEHGAEIEAPHDLPPERERAARLLGILTRFAVARVSGRSADESFRNSLAWAGAALDPEAREALEVAFEERHSTGAGRAA